MMFHYKRLSKDTNYLLELWTYLYFTNEKSAVDLLINNRYRLITFMFLRNFFRNSFVRYNRLQKAKFKRVRATISEIGIGKESLSKMSISELENLRYFMEVPIITDAFGAVILDSLKNTFSMAKNFILVIGVLVTSVSNHEFLGNWVRRVSENGNHVLEYIILAIVYYLLFLVYRAMYKLILAYVMATSKKREISRILPLLKEKKRIGS